MSTKASQPISVLKEKLAEKPTFKVVAMPDFFLDYILAYPGKLDDLAKAMVDVAGRGGGEILRREQLVGMGGQRFRVSLPFFEVRVYVSSIIWARHFGKHTLSPFFERAVFSLGQLNRTIC